MNTIPFTTDSDSHSNALRYLADVAAAQEWTDALGAMRSSPQLPHRSYTSFPARRRRHSRKAARAAGPPSLSGGVPSEIRELVQKVLETQRAKALAEQASAQAASGEPAASDSSSSTPRSLKPSLKLAPWSYPPIDEDAITPPSPILMEGARSLAPFLDEAYGSYTDDSELETETETELETEVDSDAGPSIHRPRIHVVDDSEPVTPEFEIETFKKWSCDTLLSKPIEPLTIITKNSATLIPVHPELTPVAAEEHIVSGSEPKDDPFGLVHLVNSTWVEEEEEEDDDEWLSGPPSYYTSPPESPHASPGETPSCSPCPTPMFTDDEYESEIEAPELPFDPATDPIATHHLRGDLEIVRPFSPLAPEITVTPPTWAAFFECMPQQDEAYGQLLALPGTTPLGPAELEHNTLVTRARIRRNPVSGSQECMWRGKWTPCCWACGGAAEGMDTTLPPSQRTGWFVLDNQRWLMVRG